MKLPNEIMSWYVEPAIRNALVKELKRLGLKQEKIAQLFEITPSAVSQYVKNKRGTEVQFEDDFNKKIKDSAKRIYNDTSLVFGEIVQLSNYFKKSKMLCNLCKKENNLDKCSNE